MKVQWLSFLFVLFSCSVEAGHLTYEILDCTRGSEGKLIAQGEKDQSHQDVTVTRKTGYGLELWSKSVYLDKGFSIGLSDSKDKVLEGFGMWVETNPDGFSWDWFNLSKGDVFEKLKEGGFVRVKTKGEPKYQEIAVVEFVTDISLRLIEPGSGGRVTHRINIKKGSVLNVP